ncbi:hypothetical protein A0O28_0006260 [Trichoderma guizhouense]|uniref:Zn(2)-C6 fungal-type domain-containing protein n=1 Tax=Trichoderma guizhouense TaxID=1491466 RepID=A0A1T3CHF7_9HYPO|nr:hypothetical protein A0O28_0006260 [Trichoderma guizhouense]
MANRVDKACLPCRQCKRRCDGVAPRCALCIKKGIDCTYPSTLPRSSGPHRPGRRIKRAEALPSAGSDRDIPQSSQHADADNRSRHLTTAFEAAAIYYIAPDVFSEAHLDLLRLEMPVPLDIAKHISHATIIRSVTTEFFRSIHTWFPIVYKKAFLTQIFNPLAKHRAELSLLALCMKLVCEPYSGANTALYHAVRQFLLEVMASGILSIHVLQAGILMVVYEMGQAIYPSAYFTLGQCVQYSSILGIDKFDLGLTGEDAQHGSWEEIEERRRGWWAVVILDRIISIHNPLRRLLTDDPTFETYLPVDDHAWEDGISGPSSAVSISTSFSLKTGLFSRLAQSTYLLGEALKVIKTQNDIEGSAAGVEEVAQLRRTVLALIHLSDSESKLRGLQFCPQVSVCISWRHPGPTQSPEQTKVLSAESRCVLDRLAAMGPSFRDNCLRSKPLRIPLFVTQVIYQIGCFNIQAEQSGLSDTLMAARLEVIMDVLQLLRRTWRLAGKFEILATKDDFANG